MALGFSFPFGEGDLSGASNAEHRVRLYHGSALKEKEVDLQLNDKKALVTGSTAGIGLAIATLFAQEGAAVIVNGRSEERVNSAVARIRQSTGNAEVVGVLFQRIWHRSGPKLSDGFLTGQWQRGLPKL
jgi:hypothetical protein